MNTEEKKFARFEDWSPGLSFTDDGYYLRKARPRVKSVFKSIKRRLPKIKNLGKPMDVLPISDGTLKKPLQKWNKIFEIICVMAVSVDPLFFYILVIDAKGKCLKLDRPLRITASVLRTFFDLLYILYIMFGFRTRHSVPSSRALGSGALITDILSIIPLPQVIVLAIIPLMVSNPSVAKDWLKYIIFIQYVPRLLRIYPLFWEGTRTSGILTETAWASAAYNLFLYMLSSHIVGAFWYLFSVESQLRCWHQELKKANLSAAHTYLSCGQHNSITVFSILNGSCPLVDRDDIEDASEFNFGMYIDALKSHVVESKTDFPRKIFYCFWWGLRNVSSLGQNLQTSTYVGEIIFAVFIAIFGLVLFSLLIGNMQQYLQSATVRVEEMKMKTQKRRELQQWMSRRMLPDWLRKRIRRYEHYKWQEHRGVEEEAIIQNFPKDLRRNIKHHLCLDLLKKVPMLEKIDERLLDALCDRLKPVLYTEKSHIIREGDPIDEMLFIMRGNLATMTKNGGRTGFLNSFNAGDFCGEELLTWALDPNSSPDLPISTRTVESISEVEAFALMADDLKFVASQFWRFHGNHIRHIFRYYSLQWRTWAACFIQVAWRHYCRRKIEKSLREAEDKRHYILQWRTWAACFIQAAWRRYCRRKIEKSLREAEDKFQDALANEEGSLPSLGATIYASRFAANALRNLRKNDKRSNRMPQKLLPLMPQKPPEPIFTSQALYGCISLEQL